MCLKFANHPVRMYAKHSSLKNLHVRKKHEGSFKLCPPPPPTKYQTTRSLADLTVCGLKVNLIRAGKSERSQEEMTSRSRVTNDQINKISDRKKESLSASFNRIVTKKAFFNCQKSCSIDHCMCFKTR
jgi:hypothetical protein